MDFNPKKMQEMIAKAQQQAQELQAQMQSTIVEATVAGGGVMVKMNGQKRVLELKIDPELIRTGDVEMIQDLVTSCLNEASRKVDEAVQASVGGLLGGMGLNM